MRTITPLTLKTLQVHTNRVCTRTSFFVSKTVREIRAYFPPTTKIQLKLVNHELSRRTVDAPSTGRFPEASSGPENLKSGSARLSRKQRQTSWKETKHDIFGKRPAATEAEEIDDRSTEADVNALRRSIEWCFFFFSTSSSNKFRFAFLALKVANQAFT